MQAISLPNKYRYTATDKKNGRVEIFGCYPGYGTTLGNALRRVLLSSLSGAAITAVKIKGVSHEFSTIPGVLEDVVQVILYLKKVRFQMHSDEPVKASLKAKGEGVITASAIHCPSSIEVVSPDQPIATVTDKKSEVEMEFEISKGIGYVPVEQQLREEKEIGVIAIDAVFTPIRRVNYEVENMRVGKRTDYNKVTLDIETDGSVAPDEAFRNAAHILVEQFSSIYAMITEEGAGKEVEHEELSVEAELAEEVEVETTVDSKEIKAADLKGISTRTLNVLTAHKINRVKDIIKRSEDDLNALEGMGGKSIKEIKKAVGELGLTLKQK